MTASDDRVADAAPDNWVDRRAPRAWRPYLKLARADRPIGIWLLFWPCAWGAALAGTPWPDPVHLILFLIGAAIMRGAGCTFNDMVDRDLDARVARTARRPLASGAVGIGGAAAFLVAQALAGLAVLVQFNGFTIILGASSLVLVAIYPFMKRVTWWPQVFLGLAFNWGALVGVAAARGALGADAALLYLAGILWTIGYDTIYAHQDREDDALIGIRSTARLFGARTKPALVLFYGGAILALAAAGVLANLSGAFLMGLLAPLALLTFQIIALRIDQPDLCLRLFKTNNLVGALVFLSIILGRIIGP